MNVKSIMSKTVHTCSSNQTALTALRTMREHDCGCIPVVDHDAVVGMITDRDIALAAADSDKSPSKLRLSQIMSDDLVITHPDASIEEAESIMREHRIRRIPVVDAKSRPVGMLSLNDIARAGASRSWKGEQGLTAKNVASTLAAVCEPFSQGARASA
jgi:CBS domain-containing protein